MKKRSVKKIKCLTRYNQKTFFKQEFYHHQHCRYDIREFLFKDVKRLAAKHNVFIEYCKPGSYGHKTYGCFCFKIVKNQNIPEPEFEQLIFNPEMLVI